MLGQMTPTQHAGGTLDAWEASDFILADRQIGVATDTGSVRVGNGADRWVDLPAPDALTLITATMLAVGAVTNPALAAGAVTDAKVADNAAINLDKTVNGISRAAVTPAQVDYLTGLPDLLEDREQRLASVSVINFGALGNGTTNDRAAFQAAVDFLAFLGGGKMIIPAGVYLINGNIQLKSDIYIEGQGATLIKTQASPYTFFVGQSNGTVGYGSGPSRIYCSGVTFRGSFNPGAFVSACAFGLHHVQFLTVERCRFVEMQASGHIFDLGGCENITIRKNVFQGFAMVGGSSPERAEAIQIDSSYNGATSTQDPPGSFDGSLTKNVFIQDNQFLPLTNEWGTFAAPNPIGAHSVRETLKYEHLQFVNNLIIDPAEQIPPSTAVNASPSGVVKLPIFDGLLVQGNRFINTTDRVVRAIGLYSMTSGNLASADPQVAPTTTGTFPSGPNLSCRAKVLDNVFIGFKPSGTKTPLPTIWIQGTGLGAETKDMLVRGNSFQDGYNAAATTPGEVAIYLTRAKGVRVEGNHFENYNAALFMSASLDTKFIGNDVVDTFSYPIYSSGSTGSIVSSNTFRRSRRPIQFDANSVEVTVNANQFLEGLGVSGDAAGINIAGAKRFLVFGNVITRLDTGVTLSQAISIYNTAADGKVFGNQVTGAFTTKVANTATGVSNTGSGTGITVTEL